MRRAVEQPRPWFRSFRPRRSMLFAKPEPTAKMVTLLQSKLMGLARLSRPSRHAPTTFRLSTAPNSELGVVGLALDELLQGRVAPLLPLVPERVGQGADTVAARRLHDLAGDDDAGVAH